MSHRAVMFGAIANGLTRVEGLLMGDDVKRTMQAFRDCGVSMQFKADVLEIEGVGPTGLKAPASAIDLGNSGTSMRLLTGLFAGQNFKTVLTGDASLSNRPMGRVVGPLEQMGAKIGLSDQRTPPVRIFPVDQLKPIDFELPIASAQVKSAVLLAALYASGQTRVVDRYATRDHTENMLKTFCPEQNGIKYSGGDIRIAGHTQLTGQHISVPADFSSAAFFVVAALLVPGSDLVLKNVGINQTRSGLLLALEHMGAKIEKIAVSSQGGMINEPVADLRIRYTSPLSGVEIPVDLVPLMIDEIPILAIAAAMARGQTVLTGCEELRVKESDRIRSVVQGLERLGVKVEERPDGMIIEGGTVQGGQIDSFGDHRIAMAFAVAGAIAESDVDVFDCECVGTSFPGFVEVAEHAGIDICVRT